MLTSFCVQPLKIQFKESNGDLLNSLFIYGNKCFFEIISFINLSCNFKQFFNFMYLSISFKEKLFPILLNLIKVPESKILL